VLAVSNCFSFGLSKGLVLRDAINNLAIDKGKVNFSNADPDKHHSGKMQKSIFAGP